jgi:5-methylthioribose kinase
MKKFDKHFRMRNSDVIEYVNERIDFFDKNAILSCDEIGDGNVNYVFRVVDNVSGKSIIIKHSDIKSRRTLVPLHIERNRLETEILQNQWNLAPGMVPKVYHHDSIMALVAMEDLSDHTIMRSGLIAHIKYPSFSDQISSFLVQSLLPTTDIVMNPSKKKELVKKYTNIVLCEVSERLVFSEPYTNINNNNKVFEPVAALVDQELYKDKTLHLEVGKLKNAFQNNSQALIHGDLHTGSIFVKEDSMKIIDPEFAFYGPIGYDVGNVIAHLLFGWANAYATIENAEVRNDYLLWIEDTIASIIDLLKIKFKEMYRELVTDVYAKNTDFMNWYLDGILADSAGFTGTELHRRIAGSTAKVLDLTSIKQSDKRTLVEKILILLGKELILRRKSYKEGKNYSDTIKKYAHYGTVAKGEIEFLDRRSI